MRKNFVDRVCKLLMLTKDRILPLPTIDQLKWNLGLPYDYIDSFIPNYKYVFSLIRLSDDRVGLKLVLWPEELAVSQLETNAREEDDVVNGRLGFRVGFPRGFGLKRKSIGWLEEWQKLPYTSLYHDSSHLDSRTDVSEKRIVGVFHEPLHLTCLSLNLVKIALNLKRNWRVIRFWNTNLMKTLIFSDCANRIPVAYSFCKLSSSHK